jgi:hypothetical protein
MPKTFYLSTTHYNDKGKVIGHSRYRMTAAEAAMAEWDNEVVNDVKEAGTFRFSQIISDESARNLWTAVSR